MNLSNRAVFHHEKRQHERKNLAYDRIPGDFTISFGDERIRFDQVNDVSISGMGILMDHSIAAGEIIRVNYEAIDLQISIEAEVKWQEKIADGVFRNGICFSNKNMDDNVMLFMALREYIDDFDMHSI